MVKDSNDQRFQYILKQEGSHGRVSGHPYKPKGRRPEPLGVSGGGPPPENVLNQTLGNALSSILRWKFIILRPDFANKNWE